MTLVGGGCVGVVVGCLVVGGVSVGVGVLFDAAVVAVGGGGFVAVGVVGVAGVVSVVVDDTVRAVVAVLLLSLSRDSLTPSRLERFRRRLAATSNLSDAGGGRKHHSRCRYQPTHPPYFIATVLHSIDTATSSANRFATINPQTPRSPRS